MINYSAEPGKGPFGTDVVDAGYIGSIENVEFTEGEKNFCPWVFPTSKEISKLSRLYESGTNRVMYVTLGFVFNLPDELPCKPVWGNLQNEFKFIVSDITGTSIRGRTLNGDHREIDFLRQFSGSYAIDVCDPLDRNVVKQLRYPVSGEMFISRLKNCNGRDVYFFPFYDITRVRPTPEEEAAWREMSPFPEL